MCGAKKVRANVKHALYIQYTLTKTYIFGRIIIEGHERLSIVTLCRRFWLVAFGLEIYVIYMWHISLAVLLSSSHFQGILMQVRDLEQRFEN